MPKHVDLPKQEVKRIYIEYLKQDEEIKTRVANVNHAQTQFLLRFESNKLQDNLIIKYGLKLQDLQHAVVSHDLEEDADVQAIKALAQQSRE